MKFLLSIWGGRGLFNSFLRNKRESIIYKLYVYIDIYKGSSQYTQDWMNITRTRECSRSGKDFTANHYMDQ